MAISLDDKQTPAEPAAHDLPKPAAGDASGSDLDELSLELPDIDLSGLDDPLDL